MGQQLQLDLNVRRCNITPEEMGKGGKLGQTQRWALLYNKQLMARGTKTLNEKLEQTLLDS